MQYAVHVLSFFPSLIPDPKHPNKKSKQRARVP